MTGRFGNHEVYIAVCLNLSLRASVLLAVVL